MAACVCCVVLGLTDDILHSVLRRVRGSVESIDLSKCPCLLTEDTLCLIGKLLLMMPKY